MLVAERIEQVRAWRGHVEGSVGFVPTMGYLHVGHLELVRRARRENDAVVVSIFVNPLQFGPHEDFARYPRDLQRDLRLLQGERVNLVFAPEIAEIYPPGFTTQVDVGPIGERLEGASRPGHFRGVATVVTKLFMIVQPHRAYFGWKDAQQVVVIRKLVADLAIPVEIVAVPTVREPDGLACSSRNVYLSPEERRVAPALYAALARARALWQEGERDAERLRQAVRARLADEPLLRVDYVSVADAATMEELVVVDRPAILSLAAWLGTTRLIDSELLGVE
ncbi:pantoate--beta-alanine ligase [Thermomicrobiaceae bacterium CFH 74404]|uniref:Pantothenate synthetase n=1 Tax=Thermalbibacter longus TaxID=2951981 RepID=A0AA41WAH4_9BACT|nr:pantoate--beta-alanine ligase [Thermalbibacter longus]MCM8747682.1 pantoate--beta-alanine ligase [Thermalbibacter longus]